MRRRTGELEEVEQYYHSYVVAMLLGPVLDVALGIEPVLNEEALRDSDPEHVGHEGELTAGRLAALGWPAWGQKVEVEKPDPGKIIHIQTALGHLTVLEMREPVSTVAVGSAAFKVEWRDERVFIEPTEPKVATNLFLWTPSGRFNYELDPAGDVPQMIFAIDRRRGWGRIRVVGGGIDGVGVAAVIWIRHPDHKSTLYAQFWHNLAAGALMPQIKRNRQHGRGVSINYFGGLGNFSFHLAVWVSASGLTAKHTSGRTPPAPIPTRKGKLTDVENIGCGRAAVRRSLATDRHFLRRFAKA